MLNILAELSAGEGAAIGVGSSAALIGIIMGLKTIVEKILDIIKTSKEQNKTTAETALACVNLFAKNENKPKKKPKS